MIHTATCQYSVRNGTPRRIGKSLSMWVMYAVTSAPVSR